MSRWTTLVRSLGTLSPIDPGLDPALDRQLAFLDTAFDSAELRRAAVGTATVAAALAVVVAALLLSNSETVAGFVVVLGGCVAYGVVGVTRWIATLRRTRALGDVPELVGLAVLRARIDPTPERAAQFASEHGRDPLAASLREQFRRAHGTPEAGWEGFVAVWGEWDPSLRRAVSLLSAAVDARPGDRERLLDRALSAALDGTTARMAEFAATLRGPTSGIYAFGVVLPLALVAVVPAARGAGIPFTVPAVVVSYDFLLPVGLTVACAGVLARRPAAFPPETVGRTHPDVGDRRALTVACGLGAGVLGWVLAPIIAPLWTRWVLVPGWAVGVGLVCWYRPVMAVRRRATAVESGLSDALALAGGRLQRDESVESAVAAVGDALAGPTGEVFADAAGVQRRLGVGIREAFLGTYGPLAAVPSPRARASVALLTLAAREGAHGGRVLVELADHLDELLAVERDARRDLAPTVGTLRSTACCFAPLVGGVTVALAGGLERVAPTTVAASPVHVGSLGIAIGAYILFLGTILAGFAVALDRGLDRAQVGYHVGATLLAASTVYPLAVTAAGRLL